MTWYVLMWHGHGLVSAELGDGRDLIMVFDDPQLALQCGQAVDRADGLRYTQVVSVRAEAEQLRGRLSHLALAGALDSVVLLFPSDPHYDMLVNQVLAAPGQDGGQDAEPTR